MATVDVFVPIDDERRSRKFRREAGATISAKCVRTRLDVVNEHSRFRGRQIRWSETYDRFGLSSDCLYSAIKSSLRTWNMGGHDLTED